MLLIRWTAVLTLIGCSLSAGAEPVVTVAASDATAAEAGSTGEITFTLSEAAPSQGLTLRYDTAGTAQPGPAGSGDYAALPGSVNVPAGARVARVTITPHPDSRTEDIETVSVRLSQGAGYRVGEPAEATVAIVDASTVRPVPVASVETVTTVLREDGTEPGRAVIRLNTPATAPLSVRFRIDGTATQDDYRTSTTDSVTIPAGASSADLIITAIDDQLVEPLQETLRISLMTGDGYTVSSAAATAQLSIEDNEPRGAGAAGAPGVVRQIDGLAERTAGLSETLTIAATVRDSDGNPVSGAATQWSLDEAGTAAGGTLSDADSFTNADGVARITLRTADQPAVYRVTVDAVGIGDATAQRIFTVTAGLIDSTVPHTPQAAVAGALDTLCPRLDANEANLTDPQRALLQRCQELINASEAGADAEVSSALRAMAPEETAAQRSLGTRVANQQLQNIAARLAALRHGATGVSMSGLALYFGDERLPASVFADSLTQSLRGGTAGDAIGDDRSTGWNDERLGIFVTGRLGDGSKARTANESGFDFTTDGITAGIDFRHSPRWVFGGALGFATTDAEMEANGGSLESDGYSLSAYSTYYWSENGYLDAVLSYGSNDFTSARNIDYTADGVTIRRSGQAETAGDQLAWSLGAGYEVGPVRGFDVEVFARADYLDAHVDGYTESGAEELALVVGEQEFDALVLSLGTRIAKAFSQSWGVLVPQGSLSWEYDTSDANVIAAHFLHDPDATQFSFDSDTPDRSAFRAGVGVSAVLRAGATVFVAWDTLAGRDDYDEQEWSVGLRFARAF